MYTQKNTKAVGVALAMAAAGLFSTTLSFDAAAALGDSGTTVDLVHCYSVNSCKGHNDCKTADNACAGQGSCKGKGFIAMPSKACTATGGQLKDGWRGTVAKADLKHCYGLNNCAGQNDCKTSDNACAGKGSCKGKGFVAVPGKACEDAGGKEGS
jgi:hypothetical protein